jgi:HD-like signal output (HDOD) protein
LTTDPLTCTSDLTAVILRDCALTTNVIATANSALYRVGDPIKTVSASIVALGFERIRSLAIGLGIVKQISDSAQNRNLYRLFAGAYFAGMFATALGKRLKKENAEELFVMGILSGLPRLLLANAYPDRYAAMEEKVITGHSTLNAACLDTFGVSYQELAAEVAQFWKIPPSMVSVLKGDDNSSAMVAVVKEACQISDMMFGNVTGGAEAMASSEKRMKTLLHSPDFQLAEFIGQTCLADQNAARFFKLAPKDVEMMVRIVEWGKVNPAEVAKTLTFGAANKELKETAQEDPALVIGQILTDLTMCVRRGMDINRILLTAMEGIFRCIRPTCVLVAFTNTNTHTLNGRFFLGSGITTSAETFQVSLEQDSSVMAKCLTNRRLRSASVSHDAPIPFLQRLNLDYLLLLPIVVQGNSIGLYIIARDTPVPFTKQEESWAEAIVEHVAMTFEAINSTPKKTA